MLYDLIIIGAGPAGCGAGIYAARKKLKTLFLAAGFGGQSLVSPEIQNWVGTRAISGEELALRLKEHLLAYQAPDFIVKENVWVKTVTRASDSLFTVVEEPDVVHQTKTVLVATGAARRKLTVPGAREFEQKGITYCASCDGPLFSGQDVAVIGGGNAGFEAASQLLAYAKTVALLHHRDRLKADELTAEKVKGHPNFKLLLNAETEEIKGDKFVKSLVYKDLKTNETRELPVAAVFVEIGLVPNTALVKDLVKLNEYQMIVVDPRTQQTSVKGVWAAGDCTDGLYHQNNIAAGDAVKAVEDIYNYLHLK